MHYIWLLNIIIYLNCVVFGKKLLKGSVLTLKIVEFVHLCAGSWDSTVYRCSDLLERIVSFLMLLMWLSNRYNHELVFGVSVKNMNKAERLIFGESLMTHAMVLTAVTEKVQSPSRSSDVCTDVFEYPGSMFVLWARSQCVSSNVGAQPVCHNTRPRLSVLLNTQTQTMQNYKYLKRRREFWTSQGFLSCPPTFIGESQLLFSRYQKTYIN